MNIKDASLYFANAQFFKKRVLKILMEKNISALVIDFSSINDVDTSAYGEILRVTEMIETNNKNVQATIDEAGFKTAEEYKSVALEEIVFGEEDEY